MNKLILMGRLTKEPEVRYTQSGKVVCQFSLAVDRPFGEKETDFIPCVIWGKPAEVLGNSIGKGHRLLVEGRLQNRNYEDKNGNKRTITECIANNFEFVEKREVKEQPAEPAQQTNASPMDNFTSLPFDEEIPF